MVYFIYKSMPLHVLHCLWALFLTVSVFPWKTKRYFCISRPITQKRVFKANLIHKGFLSTDSLQRATPENWCCWWGAVWHRFKSVQKWHRGKLYSLLIIIELYPISHKNETVGMHTVYTWYYLEYDHFKRMALQLSTWLCHLCWKKDTGLVSEDLWVEGQDEEAKPEESEGVCWRHAGSSAGL